MGEEILRESPVVIEGIGERTEEALREAGIGTIGEMLSRGVQRIAQAVPTATERQVRSWSAAGLLLQVEGVDPNVAEALIDAGIDSVDELAEVGLQTLERAMDRAVEAGKLKEAPSLYRLAGMQREAGKLRDTGLLGGRVVNRETGEPLAGLTVRAGRRRGRTEQDGTFYLSGVPAGTATVEIDVPGRRPLRAAMVVPNGTLGRLVTFRVSVPPAGRPPPRQVDESDGRLVWLGRAGRLRLVTRQLADLPDETYLVVQDVSPSGRVRLQHAYRKKVGHEVVSELVDVPADVLPEEVAVGQIFQHRSGELVPTDLTRRDVETRKLLGIIGERQLHVTSRRAPFVPGGGGR